MSACVTTGQHGPVWFPTPDNYDLGLNALGTVTCHLPVGEYVLLGPGYECSTVERPPFHASTDAGLLSCAHVASPRQSLVRRSPAQPVRLSHKHRRVPVHDAGQPQLSRGTRGDPRSRRCLRPGDHPRTASRRRPHDHRRAPLPRPRVRSDPATDRLVSRRRASTAPGVHRWPGPDLCDRQAGQSDDRSISELVGSHPLGIRRPPCRSVAKQQLCVDIEPRSIRKGPGSEMFEEALPWRAACFRLRRDSVADQVRSVW